jgi:hypothetical protein
LSLEEILMNTSRWTFATGILATGIVLAGVAIGAAAYFASEGVSAQTGSVGPSLAFVPQGASLIGYIDLKSVASSPLAESWSESTRERTPLAALDEIEESTGIDLLNDVDSVTLAIGAGTGKPERWGIAVEGVFDRDRLVEKLSAHKGEVETSSHAGTDLYLVRSGTQSTAMAQPDDSTLLLGEPAYVREMLDAGSGARPSATGNLEGWGYGDFEGEAFWFAGTPPDVLHGLVGPGSEKDSLRSFAITGRLDTDLLLRARGQAVDSKTAQELADVVRGLIALGRLRQDPTPEGTVLGKMMESVSVELVEESIDVNLLVPYESIRKLLESHQKEANAR